MNDKINPNISEVNLTLLRKGGSALVSFPRSGSTLTRNIFSEMMRLRLRLEFPDISTDAREMNPKVIVPNLNTAVEDWPERLGQHPLMMRTHEREPIAEFRTVFLFRDPLDAIHSYFSMQRARAPIPDVDGFFGVIISLWQGLAQEALNKVDTDRRNICVVRYENYLAAPEETVMLIAKFIGFPVRPAHVRKAVRVVNARFAKGKAFAPTPDQPERGSPGAGAKRLDPAVAARVMAALGPDFDLLCLASRQQGTL